MSSVRAPGCKLGDAGWNRGDLRASHYVLVYSMIRKWLVVEVLNYSVELSSSFF